MDKEKKIFTEVYVTLDSINKELFDKIPRELKEEIYSKADTSFPYKVEELMPESKALIAAILEKYILDK